LLRLRRVEEGLRTHPRRAVDPAMTARILAAIAEESSVQREGGADAWQLLPLDVWLPAATLLTALMILVLSIPEHLGSLASRYAPQPELLERAVSLPQVLAPVQEGTSDPLFWAVWIGLSVVLAGLGLCVSLSAWSADSSQGLAQIEAEVAGFVQRLREGPRRAS
jgi:hypothetical protein